MRRYDDLVEVRRGAVEAPEQFLWRGRLWSVRAVLAHWVETGPWWHSSGARAALGADRSSDEESGQSSGQSSDPDPMAEREVWRVEAGRGRLADSEGWQGVFDLAFDWAQGTWRLTRCMD